MVKSGKMKKVVLVRLETSPEDIVGMQVSQGILTVRGGMTSHAAVVARGMGTCCVSGCGNDNEVKIDEEAKTFEINGHKFVEGDWISIDGSTGNIYGEQVATVAATGNKNFNRFMGWADAARQLLVMTNADNPRDAQQAVDLGAEGIGLCRTEHMFFAEDRIKAVREMICARTVEEREAALAKVEPFQQGDFEAMYRIMGERPMTIRYLDPPLHEFLPTKDEDIKELAADMGMTFDDLKNVVTSLHEFNPMMGHRGCRLAVTYPEIAAMQTRAVIKAALNVSAETGHMITPHIMIPLVGEVKELKFVKDVVVKVADELIAAAGVEMKYQVGTMIEIPRAALTAGEIAKEAEFFSFGTNDLTQMTFGFSVMMPPSSWRILREQDLRERSVPASGPDRRWQAGQDGCPRRPRDPSRSGSGYLRRARRRPHERGVLPQCRSGLRQLLSLPCAYRTSGCCSGCY